MLTNYVFVLNADKTPLDLIHRARARELQAKGTFTHVSAGDIVKVFLPKDRKNVKSGTYTTRVKTPTVKGCEVLINGLRVGISSMKNLTFVHRSDGYSYEYFA